MCILIILRHGLKYRPTLPSSAAPPYKRFAQLVLVQDRNLKPCSMNISLFNKLELEMITKVGSSVWFASGQGEPIPNKRYLALLQFQARVWPLGKP